MKSIASRAVRGKSGKGGVQSGLVPDAYWSIDTAQLLSGLRSSSSGLSQSEAEARLKQYGANTLEQRRQATALALLLRQFRSPLVLILIFAAAVSGVLGEWVDAS